jgi:hypothetical protein
MCSAQEKKENNLSVSYMKQLQLPFLICLLLGEDLGDKC